MRPFLVCIHDATPAYASETRTMLRGLAPMVGRQISVAVVPDWHGAWPLASHPDYSAMLRESAEELLLHGYFHRRGHGWGPVTWLAEGSDEMNGMTPDETRRMLTRGQRVFSAVFGAPANGFLAPAWQRGRVDRQTANAAGFHHVLGLFSLESVAGRQCPLATWTWDCGRWSWLGEVGRRIGSISQSLDRGIPTLAIHPRDIGRGYWPMILRLTRKLLDAGYEPATLTRALETT